MKKIHKTNTFKTFKSYVQCVKNQNALFLQQYYFHSNKKTPHHVEFFYYILITYLFQTMLQRMILPRTDVNHQFSHLHQYNELAHAYDLRY